MAEPTRGLRHLGVNAVFLQPRMGGVETYVRSLLPAILEAQPNLRMSVFVSGPGRELLEAESWSPAVELVSNPLLGVPGTRAITEATVVGALATRRGCDVLHSVALTAPLRTRPASVITIADMTWLRQPGAVPIHTRMLWRAFVFPAARRASRVIAHSHAARAEIAADMGIEPERIDVVPHGPGSEPVATPTPEAELRERLRLGDGPLVLALSALLAHKNVDALVEALPTIRDRAPGAALVVPANPTPLGDQLARRAGQLGVDQALVLPGWLPAADLEGLYVAATCFAFPSLREGFGLPVLEAMRRGLPVACSNASSVPEVAGDAALLFDPTKPHEIAESVVRLILDAGLRKRLTEKGRRRAAQFTWGRAAEQTLASYRRAQSSP